MAGLKIGEVARRAGVNLQTLRYYERRGLLPEPPRSWSNYRIYSEEAVTRVKFIKRAQTLGFTLREIAELLDLGAQPDSPCEEVQRRAEEKIRQIEEKIATLDRMRQALLDLVEECRSGVSSRGCPVLEALTES
ncbi:MAG: Hg(II)-responsive transcriptional regulator [Acidobacteriota bacterium]